MWICENAGMKVELWILGRMRVGRARMRLRPRWRFKAHGNHSFPVLRGRFRRYPEDGSYVMGTIGTRYWWFNRRMDVMNSPECRSWRNSAPGRMPFGDTVPPRRDQPALRFEGMVRASVGTLTVGQLKHIFAGNRQLCTIGKSLRGAERREMHNESCESFSSGYGKDGLARSALAGLWLDPYSQVAQTSTGSSHKICSVNFISAWNGNISDISAISVEIGRAKATFFSPNACAKGKKLVSILRTDHD